MAFHQIIDVLLSLAVLFEACRHSAPDGNWPWSLYVSDFLTSLEC